MGEIIKDIGMLKMGDNTFRIELNEPYSTGGRERIHLQNDTFRYDFAKKDFLDLMLLTLRAKDNLHYIKTNKIRYSNEKRRQNYDVIPNIAHFPLIHKITELQYKVVETRGDVVTLLVNNNVSEVKKTFMALRSIKLSHPMSKRNGYKYLYKMKPFQIFEKDKRYYEIIYKLPSLSLTKKTWMPLDMSIQESIWKCNNKCDGVDVLDDENLLIYRIVNAVFYQNELYEQDNLFFSGCESLLDNQSLHKKLSTVFFAYSDELIKMLKNKQYDDIVNYYFHYQKY